MIHARDPSVHERIANDPSVYRFVNMGLIDGRLSFELFAANPERFVMLHNGSHEGDPDADAAFLFDQTEPASWEMHTMFLRSARGRNAVSTAHEMIAYMYDDIGADRIWGECPVGNERARDFFIRLGAQTDGFATHPLIGQVELFSCSREGWRRLPHHN